MVGGLGEADLVAVHHGLVGEVLGEHGLADAVGSDEDSRRRGSAAAGAPRSVAGRSSSGISSQSRRAAALGRGVRGGAGDRGCVVVVRSPLGRRSVGPRVRGRARASGRRGHRGRVRLVTAGVAA